MEKQQLENMKITELREAAKAAGMKNVTKMKKQELIESLASAAKSEKSDNVTPRENKPEQKEKNITAEKNSESSAGAAIEYSDPVRRTNLMSGVLEIMADGYGFLRSNNYQSGENDVYVSQNLIRRFNLKTGDFIIGNSRMQHEGEKYQALLYVQTVNGDTIDVAIRRKSFDDLSPIYPTERLKLERGGIDYAMRLIDLVAPVGKGQRGIIVAPP